MKIQARRDRSRLLIKTKNSSLGLNGKKKSGAEVVFTKTLVESPCANTILAKGDIEKEVNNLKNQS